MKKMVLLVLLLALLGGGGYGGWMYMQKGEAAEADAAAADEPAEPETPPVFVQFNPIVLPLVGDDRIEQFVTVRVVLEVGDEETGAEVIGIAPRLNDAFLRSLYGTLTVKEAMPNGALNLNLVKDRLLAECKRTPGGETVRNILVQMVDQRYV